MLDSVLTLVTVMTTVNPLSLAIVFLFGTLFGSFINVCIARLPVGKSIVWPGSACMTCGVPLSAWQNVPVFSYLALGGRCHYCHTRFSPRYLLLELWTGAVAAALYAHVGGPGYPFVYDFLFSGLLVIVFFVDLDAWLILDEVSYFGIAAGILGAWGLPPRYRLLEDYGIALAHLPEGAANLAWAAAGALLGYLFFWAIARVGSLLARQEAMGRGDVKFAALMGAFLGPYFGFMAMMLSFLLGTLVAVPLVLLQRKGGKTPVPFGTFMAVAALGTVFFGDRFGGWSAALADWLGRGLFPHHPWL